MENGDPPDCLTCARAWERRRPLRVARLIARDARARRQWVGRLAGKLASDDVPADAPLLDLERALRHTTLRSVNVAVLRELEADVRAEMRRFDEETGP